MNLFYFLALILFSSFSHLKEGPEEVCVSEFKEPVLFVSLGSHCEASDVLRNSGVRKAAFPFDWILSSDGKKLIELLQNDFLHFTTPTYLTPVTHSERILINTYCNVEFHHEGRWKGEHDYNMDKLIAKYEKRINRFRQLKDYQGKVFFFRFSNPNSMAPNFSYRCKENLEITEEYSLKLHKALIKYFPHLDFDLIIVNSHRREELKIEKQLLDNLLMIRSNPHQPKPLKTAAYTDFFNRLVAELELNYDGF